MSHGHVDRVGARSGILNDDMGPLALSDAMRMGGSMHPGSLKTAPCRLRERRRFLESMCQVGSLGLLAPAWVLAAPEIVVDKLLVSYNEDYPPYSWAEKGAAVGILPDLLVPLLSASGVRAVRGGVYPWRRAQAVVQQGEADAICTFASEERKAYAVFSRVPVSVLKPEIFFAANNPRRAELESLSSRDALRQFALVDQQGNQWAEQNLSSFPNIQFVGGHDIIFRMVLSGRADLHVSLSPIVTRWRLKKLGIDQGVNSRPAPFIAAEVPFHLGIRKTLAQAEAILAALDRQLSLPDYRKQHDAAVARY